MQPVARLVLACTMTACTFSPAASLLEPDASPAPPGAPDASLVPAPPPDAPDAPDARPEDPFCDPGDGALVACFRFEDAVADASGAALQVMAGEVSFADGKRGRGMVTTSASEVRLAEATALDVDALTLEMWVYPDAIPGSGRAGLFDNDGQYGLFVHPGGLAQCTGAAAPVEFPAAVAVGRWTHLACTNDGQTARLYVDGQERASGATAPLNRGTRNGSAIGGNLPSGDPFLGRIDDLRIWSRVRTGEEICAAADCTSP